MQFPIQAIEHSYRRADADAATDADTEAGIIRIPFMRRATDTVRAIPAHILARLVPAPRDEPERLPRERVWVYAE